MGKTTVRDNFRVEVEPRNPGDLGPGMFIGGQTVSEEEWERACDDIAKEIRRHVDGLPNDHYKGTHVFWDTHDVCEHCGSQWTEDTDEHNGGCCATDSENVPEDF